jgi:hypothetical protein
MPPGGDTCTLHGRNSLRDPANLQPPRTCSGELPRQCRRFGLPIHSRNNQMHHKGPFLSKSERGKHATTGQRAQSLLCGAGLTRREPLGARDNESQTVRLFRPDKTGRPRDLGAPDLRRSGGARRSQQIEAVTGKKIKRARKSLESREEKEGTPPPPSTGGSGGRGCEERDSLWQRKGPPESPR